MARKISIESGSRFGMLTVLEPSAQRFACKSATYLCECDCGGKTIATGPSLRNGRKKSCGCLVDGREYHGMWGTRTYTAWESMKQRCKPNSKHRRYYAARGITYCDRWASFSNFLADMGEAPEGMELDRIDNDGNYEPSNCRWATRQEQMRNSRAGAPRKHDIDLPRNVYRHRGGYRWVYSVQDGPKRSRRYGPVFATPDEALADYRKATAGAMSSQKGRA